MRISANEIVDSTDAPQALSARCAFCGVRRWSICDGGSDDETALRERLKSVKLFEAGEDIFRAGEPLTYVGNILHGVVKLTHTLADGRRQMVGLRFPSDFLGRIGKPAPEFDATAAGSVMLCRFRIDDFEVLLEKSPGLRRRLLEKSHDELHAAHELQLLLGRKSAREKVASFLCMVAHRSPSFDAAGGFPLQLPITRADIADYLGLTIETVSRQLSKLRRDDLIAFTGVRDVDVLDFPGLRSVSGG